MHAYPLTGRSRNADNPGFYLHAGALASENQGAFCFHMSHEHADELLNIVEARVGALQVSMSEGDGGGGCWFASIVW